MNTSKGNKEIIPTPAPKSSGAKERERKRKKWREKRLKSIL